MPTQIHVTTHIICIVGCLFSSATNFVDFVVFWTSPKFASSKIIGNPIVTWIAD